MISFSVQNMSCGRCVAAITQAIAAVDPAAQLRVDVAQKRVDISATTAASEQLEQALADAGYPPVPIAAQEIGATPAGQPAARSGCCCG